ncbi:hypothetical protein VNI00_005465 [Paramarasmius palmivorus]|uniref:Cytochrome P450 n=1 Tax=Paramarasmius palmivorus TaxID=297713 RepID=A0AAW0DGN4_9AGAR
MDIHPSHAALYLTAGFVIVSLVWRKVSLADPLRRFPGPSLAKRTRLYRVYYDVVVGGGWLSHLRDLHELYDPSAYADIYSSSAKMLKDPHLYTMFNFGLPPNVFTETDPKEHTVFKSMLGTFFSRQGILRLENAIQERVDTLVSQLAKNHKNKPARMNDAFRSTTLDIITTYTLRSEIDVTSFPFFEHPVILSLNERLSTIWFFKHFPSFIQLSNILPRWLSAILMPSSVPQLATMKQVSKLVDEALQETQDKEENETDSNVFYTLIRNAGSKHQHKVTRGYLICEGWNLRIAGSDTVGNACTVGTWYLVQEDRVRKKLVSELDEAWPDRDGLMPLERLEKLPYLVSDLLDSWVSKF